MLQWEKRSEKNIPDMREYDEATWQTVPVAMASREAACEV
jgi:hypothetical protein